MTTQLIKKSLLSVLSIMLISTAVIAQERFVATTGDDTANDCSSSGTPCLTVQHAIDQASASDEISVAAGTYRENLLITKSLTLTGSNAGVAGTGTRGTETIIQPGSTNLVSGIVVTVAASSVAINGFTISGDNDVITGASSFDALTGVYFNATAAALTGFDFQNNIVRDFPRDNTSGATNAIDGFGVIPSAGVIIQGSDMGTSGHTVRNNWFRDIDDEPNDDYADNLGFGLVLLDSAYADISDNRFTDVGGGLAVSDVPKASATDSLVVERLYMSRSKVGIIANGGSINFTADSVTIVNPVAFGVRLVKADDDDTDFYLKYSSITGAGSSIADKSDLLTNYSGFAAEKYSGAGTQTVRIDSCVISDNRNRGITFRGNVADATNVGAINFSTLEGNAYDGQAGNAYTVIVNRVSVVDMFESTFSNQSSSNTATTYDAIIGNNQGNGSNAGVVTMRSCAILSTTGADLVSASGPGLQMDASGNWWGNTAQATIEGDVSSNTDFSPWLNSGTDENASKAGFQPDLDKINVGSIATQTGASEFIQEGITDFTEADTLIIQAGTYNENPTVDRNVVFETIPTVLLDQITMNGTGIALTLNGDLSIDQGLTLTDGNIAINEGVALTLTSSASDFSEAASSLIQGTVSYQVSSLLATGGLNFLGVNFVSGNNTLSNLIISRVTGVQGTNDGVGGSSIGVTWSLTADNTPDNWIIRFSWPSVYDNGNDISDLRIWRDGGSGYAQVAGPLTATGDPRVTQDITINSFSDYTAADGTVTLPVTLSTFVATETGMGQAMLRWTTLSEVNADFFQVERSSDGVTFAEVARINAAGFSSDRRDYEYVDSELIGDEVFYRLKMVDLDGTFEYSPTIYLALSDEIALLYPNPATDYIKIPLADRLPVQLQIYDQRGRTVKNGMIADPNIDVSALASGVYYYQIAVGGAVENGKLIIR